MLSFASHFTQNKVSTRNPRHSESLDIKFWRFKTSLCNHHSLKPGLINTLGGILHYKIRKAPYSPQLHRDLLLCLAPFI